MPDLTIVDRRIVGLGHHWPSFPLKQEGLVQRGCWFKLFWDFSRPSDPLLRGLPRRTSPTGQRPYTPPSRSNGEEAARATRIWCRAKTAAPGVKSSPPLARLPDQGCRESDFRSASGLFAGRQLQHVQDVYRYMRRASTNILGPKWACPNSACVALSIFSMTLSDKAAFRAVERRFETDSTLSMKNPRRVSTS